MTAHIAGFLAAATERRGTRPLFFCEGRTTTGVDAAKRVAALATGLVQRLGIQPGDRVCLVALATDHSLEALLAITSCGAIAAPINWRWSPGEAAYAVELVDASAILADAACAELALALAARCPSLRAVVLLGPVGAYSSCPAFLGGTDGGTDGATQAPAPAAGEPSAGASGAGASTEEEAQPPALAPTLLFAECLLAECPASGAGTLPLRTAPGNAALIVFTSGTTGRPKGVALSHDALHAQCMAKLLVCGYSASDVYLHAAPLFHIGGLNSALAMLLAGAQHVFLPRFDPAGALGLIARHGVTNFIAVPTMVADLVSAAATSTAGGGAGGGAPYQQQQQVACVTRVLLGGGGTPPALLAQLTALFPAATIQSAYGMTEAASSLTFATVWTPVEGARPAQEVAAGLLGTTTAAAAAVPGDDGSPHCEASEEEAAGAAGGVYVGRPPPGIELAVFQPAGAALEAAGLAALGVTAPQAAAPGSPAAPAGTSTGRVVQQGQGEVVTRGPHVLLGYWEDEEATAAAMLPGGWMRTGDLGCLSDGNLWLLGRAKDMIKSGGENVHAWEVERALLSHPAVAAAAVVGVSDWRLGEAVAAAVALRLGWAWQGGRCQVLLPQQRQRRDQARQQAQPPQQRGSAGSGAALAAAEAQLAAGGGSRAGEAAAGDNRRMRCSDDLRSTLRQEQPSSRPGSAQAVHGSGGGLLAALLPYLPPRSPKPPPWRAGGPWEAMRQVAAGLEEFAALSSGIGGSVWSAAAAAEGEDGGSGQGAGPASQGSVGGPALQQHCRAVGLAGFKLPRVFLLCTTTPHAAARTGRAEPEEGEEESGQAAEGDTDGGRTARLPVLPVTSTGKVAKHLLRQLVVQHMKQSGAGEGGDRLGGPRSRL